MPCPRFRNRFQACWTAWRLGRKSPRCKWPGSAHCRCRTKQGIGSRILEVGNAQAELRGAFSAFKVVDGLALLLPSVIAGALWDIIVAEEIRVVQGSVCFASCFTCYIVSQQASFSEPSPECLDEAVVAVFALGIRSGLYRVG